MIRLQPDHAAARRALGHEQVDGAWMSAADARRKRGLVLFEGRWLLPAEVEAAARKDAPPVVGDALRRRADASRAAHVGDGRGAAGPGGPHGAGRGAVRTSPARRARHALRRGRPRARGLRPHARRDRRRGGAAAADLLRRARHRRGGAARGRARGCVLRPRRHRHPLHPRAGSENLRLVANAAEALADLGDPRALGYIVKRLTSHGSSARAFVSFINQVSYVRDYDVEIAQASNIANPDVAIIQDGVVLDVRVIDAGYTKTWIEPILVGAASRLAGREFANRDEVLAWYAEEGDGLPDYPSRTPGRRKRPGKVIGAVESR